MKIFHLGSPHPSNSSGPVNVVRGVQREVVVDDMSHLRKISWLSTTRILLNVLTSWVSRPRDIKSVAEIILTCNFVNESILWGFQMFLLHLSSQKFVQAFSSLNEVLSLTEANAVNVIFFQEHLNKIGSGGLVAENYHLRKVLLAIYCKVISSYIRPYCPCSHLSPVPPAVPRFYCVQLLARISEYKNNCQLCQNWD